MRVSSRIVISLGVLMILSLAALGYELYVVNRMQRINDDLSKVDFVAASRLVQMEEQAVEIDLLSQKYFVLSERVNRETLWYGLTDAMKAFEANLREVQKGQESWEAPGEVALLATAWINYKAQMQSVRDRPAGKGLQPPPEKISAAIAEVQQRTQESLNAIQTGISAQVQRSQEIGRSAETISLGAAGLFVVTGALLAFLMLKSINRPLRQLTSGTRKITRGDFSHRLPAGGPQEFAELARDFNTMTERLGELDQMKKDFVSHVSHELKAPLAAIRQTLAVTLEQIPGPINAQQRKLLELSRNSAERLTAMVANLLDVSRLDAGTMEYEMAPHDLVALVRNVAEEFRLKADERHIRLNVKTAEPEIRVNCDRDRMIQVVGNLLDNALKFSPVRSEIQIDIRRVAPNSGSGPSVSVSVTDSGPGIADAHKNQVFAKFHQIKGGGKRAAGQGVGLGLAIAKNIVDAHRGRIWVEDNPGGGSVFRFELRIAKELEVAKCV
jgi:two-component system sensor histidine kinase GlrK